MSDRLGQPRNVFYNPVWNFGSNWVVTVTGNYTAGWGGFDTSPGGGVGFDNLNNQFQTPQLVWTSAIVKIDYVFGFPTVNLAQTPAGGIGSGIPVTVDGTTDDPLFVNPVGWSWYVDGVLQSTAGSQFQWQGGTPGSVQSIQGTAVDAYGRTHTSAIQVTTCAGSEITC